MFLLFFNYNCYIEQKSDNKEPRYVYHKGDFNKLRSEIQSVKWNVDDLDIVEHWEFFTCKIIDAMDNCIPKSKPGNIQKKKWVTAKALKAIQEKKKSWKKYKYCKSNETFLNYVFKRNQCTREVRHSKREFERKLCDNIKEYVKSFWT